MHYILLVYQGPQWSELTNEEKNRVHEECEAWHENLVKSGHSRGCNGLQPVSTATTLRERGGQSMITDGPFAETKEVLGGFEVIECKDLDEAIAIGKRFPALRVGAALEVRPMVKGGTCREE